MRNDEAEGLDWASWLTLRDAVAKIRAIVGSETASRNAILERLIGSQILAIARIVKIDGKSGQANNSQIKAEEWRRVESAYTIHADWWQTGDFRIFVTINTAFAGHQTESVRMFGIRLNPQDVDAMLADLGVKAEPTQETENHKIASLEADAASLKKNISQSHLDAWWTFYRAITESGQQNERGAISHFTRCFPDHKVPRDKIRELRGHPKPGRKPKSAD